MNRLNNNRLQLLLDQRNSLINNTPEYRTADRLHHIQTVQIINRQEWDNFGDMVSSLNNEVLPLFRFPYSYIDNLLEDYENGYGNFNGDLLISFISEYRNGMYNTIFFIHTHPHSPMVDGEMFQIQFREDTDINRYMNEFFYNSIVENISEYQMITLVREEQSAIDLLYTFLYGFNSLLISNEPIRNFSFGVLAQPINNEFIPMPINIYPSIPHFMWMDVEVDTSISDCSICLGSHDTCVNTPCGHLFGKNCLSTWIDTGKNTCPYCRSNFLDE